MSTRGTITFVENGIELVKLYNHYDSYVEGLGFDIANWLKKKKIGNGIRPGDELDENYCNGFGCLVAQFIRDFKSDAGVGGLYVVPLDSDVEDYNYRIEIDEDNEIKISITEWDEQKPFFVGTPLELLSIE